MAAQDIYGNYGSVPTANPSGTGGGRISTNASPQEFGAGVGESLTNVGKVTQDVSLQYLKMVNETEATNAETDYVTALGQKKAQFYSLEGLATKNALPKYMEDVTNLRQQYRQSLPPAGQRAFDTLALRHQAYAISDASSYTATQIKQADLQSANAQVDLDVMSAKSLDVAQSDQRFNDTLQSIRYGSNRMLSNKGWNSAPGASVDENGNFNFDTSTDEGKQAKAIYDNFVGTNVAKAYENRYKSLAENINPMEAYKKYQTEKDQVPPQGQLALDTYFKPKIQDYQAKAISEDALTNSYDDYQNTVLNKPDKFNIGNVKSHDNQSAFARPQTPEDGVILTANNLRNNYQGLTLAQIANKWAPPSENNTNNWLTNVSKASGINPNATLNLNDPATLSKLVLGIGTAEKTKSDLSSFTSEIINSGISKSIAGTQPNLRQDVVSQTGAAVPSIGNYIQHNYGDIINQAQEAAQRQYPGDIEFIEKTQARTKFQLDQVLAQEKHADEAAQNVVYQGINGNFTSGVKPTSLEELGKVNPTVQDAIDKLQVDNPKAIASYNKMLMANPTSKLGNAYQYLQQEAFSGTVDVNRLLDHVSDGSLTQPGFDKLKSLIKASPSPGEQSENDQMKSLSSYVYDTIAHSNRFNDNSQIQDSANSASLLIGKYIDQQKDKGVSVATLTNPQNKEFEPIRNIIKQFSTPLNVQLQNRASRIDQQLKTTQPLAPNQLRQPGETPEQYLQRLK